MIFMIAAVVQGNNTIGFRLLDTNTGQVMNTPYNSVVSVLRSKQVKIENIRIDYQGNLSYIDSLSKYTKVDRAGKLLTNERYVVVNQRDNVCVLVNYLGNASRVYINEFNLDMIANRSMIKDVSMNTGVEQKTKSKAGKHLSENEIRQKRESEKGLRELATKIGYYIKGRERQNGFSEVVDIGSNHQILILIENNFCNLELRDKQGDIIKNLSIIIHTSKGYAIVDVYIINVLKLLRLIPNM